MKSSSDKTLFPVTGGYIGTEDDGFVFYAWLCSFVTACSTKTFICNSSGARYHQILNGPRRIAAGKSGRCLANDTNLSGLLRVAN